MNVPEYSDLMDARIRAVFRDDPETVRLWGSAQAMVHMLRQRLLRQGWSEAELFWVTQEWTRSLWAQLPQIELRRGE